MPPPIATFSGSRKVASITRPGSPRGFTSTTHRHSFPSMDRTTSPRAPSGPPGSMTGLAKISRPPPICATSKEAPPTLSRIRTSAECPPDPLENPAVFMAPSFEDIERRASRYAQRRGLELGPRQEAGKDGIVFWTLGSPDGPTAVKALRRSDLYKRELACYRRLDERGVGQVCGHSVPQLLGHDDELLVIEMTIVTKPYVLDFAGAYIDDPPEFPPYVMEERHAHWAEVFENRWPAVQAIIAHFRRYGIHLLNPSPGNIAFEGDDG